MRRERHGDWWMKCLGDLAVRRRHRSARSGPGFGGSEPIFRAIFQDDSGVVAVPFTSAPTMFGSWNIHGGVEFLMLGDRNEAVFGDSSYVIGSIGTGLSY